MRARGSLRGATGVALFAVVAGTIACVEKALLPTPGAMVLRIDLGRSLAAQIGPEARRVFTTVAYERSPGLRITLATDTSGPFTPSSENLVQVPVDAAPCFADGARTGPADTCALMIAVAVRDFGTTLFDSVETGPIAIGVDTRNVPVSVDMAFVGSVTIESSTPDTAIVTGLQRQLSATLRTAGGTLISGRNAQWESSSPQVASINSDGLVTALAPGSTSITATSALAGDFRVVTVRAPAPTTVAILGVTDPATGFPVALNAVPAGTPVEFTISVGLEPGLPAQLTWTSSNPSAFAAPPDQSLPPGPGALTLVFPGQALAQGAAEICVTASAGTAAQACIVLNVVP